VVDCSWEDFLRAAESDPLHAEAAIALARAPTVRTAAILLDQYNGAFATALDDILASLDRGDSAAAQAQLDALTRFAPLGRHLTTPWRVTVAGAPNVGKSSLVNALAGYQRCIVAPTPGTTRDVVTVTLAIGGWPVALADTAGVRTSGELLEVAGIQLAREAAAKADLCLWVLDLMTEPIWPDLRAGNVRLVVNKCDLVSNWDLEEPAVHVSALSGEGVPELCAAISAWLVPEVPAAGAAVPFTEQLCEAVETASRHLARGQTGEARDRINRFRGLSDRAQ
jgi:tRNA modification GTPase